LKKLPILSFIVFVSLAVFVIILFNNNFDTFGKDFIAQIRIADNEEALSNISDDSLISIGKKVCESSDLWSSEKESLIQIQKVLGENGINVNINNRILPILRFQSTYELCPEYINRLESLFVE
jgi:hypothetical protein